MINMFTEERVISLEHLMIQVWQAFAETDRRFEETARRFEETARLFKETDRRIAEHSAETDRRIALRSERTDRKLKELSQEVKLTSRDIRDSNKRWGKLSNKMGTLVEDFVAPSISRILCSVTGCSKEQVEWTAERFRRRHPADSGRMQEFDAVAVCGQYVLINETKSSLDPQDVDKFVRLMSEAREFLPEYAERHFIGAIASLNVHESVVRYGQKQGLLVLGVHDLVIKVLNRPDFAPKKF